MPSLPSRGISHFSGEPLSGNGVRNQDLGVAGPGSRARTETMSTGVSSDGERGLP